MPVYEYRCPKCEAEFTHLWRSMAEAGQGCPPPCPECESADSVRVFSPPNVLGGLGGLTPGEKSEVRQAEEKLASITPKSQIDQLQANRPKPGNA